MHWSESWAEENLLARKRLKENGLSFRNAQCATAAYSPSRASIMTGLNPSQHRVKNLVFSNNPKDKSQRCAAPQQPAQPRHGSKTMIS